MEIKEVIELAIKNDWGIHTGVEVHPDGDIYLEFQGEYEYTPEGVIFLDPLFWQALGKAMGWKDQYSDVGESIEGWLAYWHDFIDTLAEGKTAEDYFKGLTPHHQ